MPNCTMRLVGASKKELEIFIYDDIGASWFSDGITADRFVKDLKDAGDLDLITLRINSYGGSVSDGLAIYNALRRNKARKEVDIDGVALSIASIIAMAGDEVRMAQNAMFMIHDPWGYAIGNAVDLRKEADVMDQFKQGLVSTYANKTGIKPDEISQMMTDETWFTAAEAAQAGFVDTVTDKLQIAAHGNASILMKKFKNVPQNLLSEKREATPRLDMARTRVAQMNKRLQTA